MQYGIVIRISKRAVTTWYRTEGKQHAPLLLKGIHDVPLYFYVRDNQFDLGAAAKERFFQNDPDAFGNYFELIKDPSRHFTLHGSSKRVKQLLYYGIEQLLAYFLNSVLYKSDSIESYRANLPLAFVFEPDLDIPEQTLIAEMFTEAGYGNIAILQYNQALVEYLQHANPNRAILLLTGLNDTLYLEVYSKGADAAPKVQAIQGQGADPRIRILSEMIVDYIVEQNPYLQLNLSKEISALLPFSSGLLSADQMIMSGDAELNNGDRYWFRVPLKSVEERLQYHTGDLMVTTAITELLLQAALEPEQVSVVLVNEQIQTPYFSERLLKAYPHLISITSQDKEVTMQQIFDQIDQVKKIHKPIVPPRLPPLPPSAVKPSLPVPKKPMITAPPPLPTKSNTPRSIPPPPLPAPKKKT
ncbi:hypothetical protein LLH06_10760 [Mucilaginibacter daejeonensis]|uniref:hypothetical protein n=1 Tax=Mucilaginibacter daejeonensis TaxID=398049 RepID=UPI001D177172|nr:hypothetical protein [Mucilaginibacter daejeonensis]UEG51454.1 hypothetical protein LLH06_10760 [Mucilaginibacter daejeonensis]